MAGVVLRRLVEADGDAVPGLVGRALGLPAPSMGDVVRGLGWVVFGSLSWLVGDVLCGAVGLMLRSPPVPVGDADRGLVGVGFELGSEPVGAVARSAEVCSTRPPDPVRLTARMIGSRTGSAAGRSRATRSGVDRVVVAGSWGAWHPHLLATVIAV